MKEKYPKFHVYHHRIDEGWRAGRWRLSFFRNRKVVRDGIERLIQDYILLLGLEYYFRKWRNEFSLQFSIGNAGSETPFDWHISIGGQALYFQTAVGRRLAHWLTSRKGGYYTRVFHLGKFGESTDLRWEIWAEKNEWSSEDPWWMHGSINLSIKDRLWGKLYYSYEVVKPAVEMVLDFPKEDGHYPVILELQRSILKRKKRDKIYDEKLLVEVEAPKGVPTHYDSSGGWKGDRTYGWAVPWPNKMPFQRAVYGVDEPVEVTDNWADLALRAVKLNVIKTRRESGFTEPQKED